MDCLSDAEYGMRIAFAFMKVEDINGSDVARSMTFECMCIVMFMYHLIWSS